MWCRKKTVAKVTTSVPEIDNEKKRLFSVEFKEERFCVNINLYSNSEKQEKGNDIQYEIAHKRTSE